MKKTDKRTQKFTFTASEIGEILIDHVRKMSGTDKGKASTYVGPSSGWEDAPVHAVVTLTS